MGCDIHMYVEVQKSVDGITKWVDGNYYKRNPYYGLSKYGSDSDREFAIIPIYDDRNYDLFAVLAGVRNRLGVQPIAEPRGVPEDACEQTKAFEEWWNDDGHSHSWLSLKELYEYSDSNQEDEYILSLIEDLEQRVRDILQLFYDEDIKDDADKIRIVFWFDN